MARSTTPHWQTALGIIILLALASLLIWGLLKVWLLFWDFITRSQPTIGATIIAGSLTILGSVFTITLTRFFEKKHERL